MPTAAESRVALQIVTEAAVETAVSTLASMSGSPEARRALLLDTVPDLIGYFSEGSAALAVDFYEEQRELARVGAGFSPQMFIADRTVKVRRAVAWASAPLFEGLTEAAAKRLAEVVQLEVARPYRDTITKNRQSDPESVGWRRVSRGGCKFCRMLADNGAVYRHDTARFSAHEHCNCTAQPVFKTDAGEEASVMQYVASKRKRTTAEQAALRDYLDTYY